VKEKTSHASALLAILCLSCLANIGCAGFSNSKGNSDPPLNLTISGTISPTASGSGVTMTMTGAASATVTTDNSGNYSFGGLANGTYTLTPSKSGFTFNPASQNITIITANATQVNFTASPGGSSTFTITGTISPAASGTGVTVTLSGAANATTVTDNNGNYGFGGLASGSYTLTPSKSGFSFSPADQNETISTADVTGANFTASQNVATTYSISGTISPAANGTGATVTLSGAASASTTTDSSGNYSFGGLASGNYTLTPSKSGFSFSPADQNETISSANVTGVDFTASVNVNGVNIQPGDDIPTVVANNPAGTTFVIYPGTYRLTQSIIPKNGDAFIGQTPCAPPTTSCPAIISGSTVIGPLAVFDGTNYKVTGQTQQNPRGTTTTNCDPGWLACIYPEDLYFDGVPYQHLYSSTLPTIGAGQWWFDYPNHIIYFHDNPAGHTVETSVIANAFGGSANNVTLQYLTVEEFAPMYPNGPIGVVQNSPQTQGANWTVQNCESRLNHNYGVRVNYGMQVLNNYLHDNGQNGINGGIGITSDPSSESINSAILIQGNIINHNDYARFSPDFGSGGIKIGATSGITVRGNTIQYNEGAGLHFDDYSQNEFVDGNTITDNTDGAGISQEIGYGTSTFRNNIALRNGAQVNDAYWNNQIESSSSTGVQAYCNVMEISPGPGINGWDVIAADRGDSKYPPYQYLVSTGNSLHHNTVIWEPGATGGLGFFQDDAANQPNFFADNPPSDYNTYHLPATADHFAYKSGTQLTFAEYQADGADIHGTADTNNTSGFPTVAITSPADQSSVGDTVTVTATASDSSGISKVEFYVDWALQTTVVSSPYSFNWTNGTSGSHTVAAMAYSNAGIRNCYAVTLNEQ
jgi:parallel beta-helix repeat protein